MMDGPFREDILRDNGVEALHEGRVVTGQGLQLGIDALSWAIFHQRLLLSSEIIVNN